jgi:hypothetical protein
MLMSSLARARVLAALEAPHDGTLRNVTDKRRADGA